ncbi:hypothetical protein KFU94_33250 [Chloroflexi bacterium TSY]|nr:hypothetical protein [Chloroflexi bacterium TSY]
MISNNIQKLIVAVALTLALTVGSGVVAEEMGLEVAPQVFACSSGTTGGGC